MLHVVHGQGQRDMAQMVLESNTVHGEGPCADGSRDHVTPGGKDAVIYTRILLVFGLVPLLVLWLMARRWIGRYVGIMLWLPLMIAFVGSTWEIEAIDRIWFYAPRSILGVRFMAIPVEEWVYYAVDALLAASLVLVLRQAFTTRREWEVGPHDD